MWGLWTLTASMAAAATRTLQHVRSLQRGQRWLWEAEMGSGKTLMQGISRNLRPVYPELPHRCLPGVASNRPSFGDRRVAKA